MAIVLTPPFATAYFLSYGIPETAPFWIESLKSPVRSMRGTTSPYAFYNGYGRIYDFVYLLMLPAFLVLHHLHQGVSGRLEKLGFIAVVVGLGATFIGVAGDYWADGAGFIVEVLGLLILAVGATVYGVAMLQGRIQNS